MKKLLSLLCFALIPFILYAAEQDILSAFNDIEQNIGGDALMFEAQAYELGLEEKGIKQDTTKAISIYAKMYKDKSPIAAYKLGLFAWQLQKQPDSLSKESIHILQNAGGLDPQVYFTTGMQSNKEIRHQELAMLNGVLLGVYLFFNEDYKGSINAFNTRSDILEHSISQMYLAFNYLALKDIKMANYHINRACFHDKPSKSVIEFCTTSDSLIHKAGVQQ